MFDLTIRELPVEQRAQINAEGCVKGYRVLSGQYSPEVMQRLDRMIYFSIFQPATMFGKPTDGEVLLSLWQLTKVVFKARLFWPIWVATTITAAVSVARLVGHGSSTQGPGGRKGPDHSKAAIRLDARC